MNSELYESIRRGSVAQAPIHDNETFDVAPLATLDAVTDQAIKLAGAPDRFPATFERYWLTVMRGRLGLSASEPDDEALVSGLLA